MKKMFKSWKTTLCGLASIITGVTLILRHQTQEGIVTILTGFGLVNAKDHDVN